jgi:hypothetical protein
MHPGVAEGGLEVRNDAGELDQVLDARLRGGVDEVRLDLEHRGVGGGDQHGAVHVA